MTKHPYQITLEWNEDDFYQDLPTAISRLPTPDVLAAKTESALRATMAAIQDLGERTATTMQSMSYPPEQVELEFGLRLGAEAGVFTKGEGDAHFRVKLVWKSRP